MKWCVLIPSYNTGADLLCRTVRAALAHGAPVWVVIDGSSDASAEAVQELATTQPQLTVLILPQNQGKGAAILHGATHVSRAGLTHVLTMDADGQHPTDSIPQFIMLAEATPETVLMGEPVFGPEAPAVRVQGRKISNALVWLQSLGRARGDCLFGMRLYPCAALLGAFQTTRHARRFDFDAEIAVRLAWQGVPMQSVPTPVRYLSAEEGGVSQFRYGRDNVLLTSMHARLMFGAIRRLPGWLWASLMQK